MRSTAKVTTGGRHGAERRTRRLQQRRRHPGRRQQRQVVGRRLGGDDVRRPPAPGATRSNRGAAAPCLIGTWKATGLTGKLSGPVTGSFTGGGGTC